jgi:uncharacterized protein YdiU (UPF0061 family)
MKFTNTYYQLPERFYAPFKPYAFSHPELIILNDSLAKELDFKPSDYTSADLAQFFTGLKTLPGSELKALAYAGHQFGHFVPSLGDGRAALLGEITTSSGKSFDLQLKGSGPTFFSRRGDGLSALGPALREYLVSEAMFYLGVPTTRSLAVVATGDLVAREEELPGGVLTRVASSHLRIGTFQYFAARRDLEALEILLHYSVKRHYSHLDHLSLPEKALEFLRSVALKLMDLIATWMGVGFIHGVMNTDNMSISGETLDFGPCAFMDHFNFYQVYSFIDKQGRYSYGEQPKILLWNLSRLADCLVPLVDQDENKAVEKLNAILIEIPKKIEEAMTNVFAKKLGLKEETEQKEKVVGEWLNYLHETKLDFTLAHYRLHQIDDFFPHTESWQKFYKSWKEASPERTETQNPLYIPRNHLIESVIKSAYQGDYAPFHELHEKLKNPFSPGQKELDKFSKPPEEKEKIKNTFCGT